MKTLKIMMAVLFSSVIASGAHAGAISWTGSAEVTYNISGSESTAAKSEGGKAMGITNDLSWNGTGELDNGYTWKISGDLDSGTVDDTYMTLTMGSLGTLGFYNDDGGMNKKHKSSQSAYGVGSDNGLTGSMVDAYDIGGLSNVRYTTPSGLLPNDISLAGSYYVGGTAATVDPGDAGTSPENIKDAFELAMTMVPAEGAVFGAQYYHQEEEGNAHDGQKKQSGTVYATYTFGPATIGGATSRVAPGQATASAVELDWYENVAYSVGFAVNDSLSISYEMETSAQEGTRAAASTYDVEVQSIQAAYTMGGMTIGLAMEDIEGAGYVQNADYKETTLSMAMDF
jgi:hypothetical protein